MNITASVAKILRREVGQNQLLGTTFVLIVLLLLSGVPFKYCILSTLLVMSHTFVGVKIHHKFVSTNQITHPIGTGFAIGSLIAVTLDQLLISTPMRDISWVVIPLVAVLTFIRSLQTSQPLHTPNTAQISITTFGFLVLIGLIQERYWPLWIAISMLPLALIGDTKFPKFKRSYFLTMWVLVVGTALLVIRNRPTLWWIKTQDFQFFESLSYSLAHWGSRDQVFATGNPILYHWFSFAWTGMISRVISAPDWIVLTKIGPPIVILFLVHVLNELLSHFGLSRNQRAFGILLVLLLNDLNFESPSMVFSYVYLVAFCILVIEFFANKTIPVALLAAALSAGALAAKSSNIAVLSGGLCGIFYFGWTRFKSQRFIITQMSIFTGFGLIIVFLSMYFKSPYGGNIEFGLVGLAQDFYGDIATLPRISFVFWSLFLLFNIVAFNLLILKTSWMHTKLRNNAFFWTFLGSTPLSIIALLISKSVHEQEEYFQHSWVIIGSICLVVLLFDSTKLINLSTTSLRRICLTSVVLVLSAWTLQLLIPTSNSGTYQAVKMRIINGSSIFLLLTTAIAILLISHLLRFRLDRCDLRYAVLVAGTIILIFSLNSRWFTDQDKFQNEVSAKTHNEYMFGDHIVQDIGEAVSTLTPENAIIASNYFCYQMDCEFDSYDPHRLNWSVGGEAMYLVVYSHRRYLASGYGFLWQNVKPSDDVVRRIELSLDFGSAPSAELLDDLHSRNVSYFVIDLAMTTFRDWTQFGEVFASNERFMLLKLKSGKVVEN
jgi:hypothetical protein